MNTKVLMTALTAGVLGMGSAYAHTGARPGQMFDALDANGDGQLSTDELHNMHQVMAEQRFKRADENGDGKIDADEFMAKAQARAEHMFKRMDRNDDGAIDADEAKPRHHGMRGHKDGDHDMAKNGGHKHRFNPVKRMDGDGDGMISRAEWETAIERHHRGDKDDSHSS